MLKIIKHEYKKTLLLPLILTAFLFVANIVLTILIMSLQLSGKDLDFILKMNYYLSYFIIAISLIYTGIMLLIKELFSYKLFEMTDIPLSVLLTTRYLAYSLTIMFLTLICCAQSTILHSFAANYHASIINNVNVNYLIFSMLNKPFLSWLFPLSVGFVCAIIYSIILILSALNNFIRNKYIKIVALAFTAIVISILLYINSSNSQSMFLLFNLNFNNYDYLSSYLPNFAYYNEENINGNFMFVFNIFNIRNLCYGIIFIVSALLLVKFRNKMPKFKNYIIKVGYISLVALLGLVFIAYPITNEAIRFANASEKSQEFEFAQPVSNIIIINKGEKASLKNILDDALDRAEEQNSKFDRKKFLQAEKRYQIKDSKNNFLITNVLIDNNLNAYVQDAGVYNCTLTASMNYKTIVTRDTELFDFTLIVRETDFSDYKKIYSKSDFLTYYEQYYGQPINAKFILMNDITINSNNYSFLNTFDGIFVNPYRHIITLENTNLFYNILSGGLLDGLIINCDINLASGTGNGDASGVALNNSGAIINCTVTGNLNGTRAGGITVINHGTVYNNIFSGKIEAYYCGGIAYRNTDKAFIKYNNYNVDFYYKYKETYMYPVSRDTDDENYVSNNNGYFEVYPLEQD